MDLVATKIPKKKSSERHYHNKDSCFGSGICFLYIYMLILDVHAIPPHCTCIQILHGCQLKTKTDTRYKMQRLDGTWNAESENTADFFCTKTSHDLHSQVLRCSILQMGDRAYYAMKLHSKGHHLFAHWEDCCVFSGLLVAWIDDIVGNRRWFTPTAHRMAQIAFYLLVPLTLGMEGQGRWHLTYQ